MMRDQLDLYDLRRREVQALGAALSCRNWHMMETAYNSLRDKLDRAGFTVAGPRATPSQRLDAATVEREALAERIRAAVTYQYMPMAVRKLLSEAAAALATEPHQHGGKGA